MNPARRSGVGRRQVRVPMVKRYVFLIVPAVGKCRHLLRGVMTSGTVDTVQRRCRYGSMLPEDGVGGVVKTTESISLPGLLASSCLVLPWKYTIAHNPQA